MNSQRIQSVDLLRGVVMIVMTTSATFFTRRR
jgi:uncharacterized membrane protein